ncbi:MAG: hypothetical protein R6V48_01520 [Fidelibacterota bacterium]
MKKLTFIFLFSLLVLICGSCGNSTGTSANRIDELRNRYDRSGEAHNEVLELVFEEFVQQKEAGELSGDIEVCRTFVRNTLSGKRLSSLDAVLSLNDEETLQKIVPFHAFAKNASNKDIVDVLSDSLNIFRKYQSVFDSIAHILDRNTGKEEKTSELEELYLYIDDSVENDEDKTGLLHSLSTIIHSVAYWEDHMQEWHELFSPNMQKRTVGIIGAIGIIDGAGAVIGTAEGFRDTEPGEEDRARKIIGHAVGEAANASLMATLAVILL